MHIAVHTCSVVVATIVSSEVRQAAEGLSETRPMDAWSTGRRDARRIYLYLPKALVRSPATPSY